MFIPGGLIDTQVNGYLGHDYSAQNFSMDEALTISLELGKLGTLQHFPTIVTRPQDTIVQNIKEIVKATHEYPQARDSITGIHVEGPFISKETGPRGAHDPLSVRPASIPEFDQWLEVSEGLLKLITLAPEAPGAIKLIDHAVKHGVVCAIGHSGASKNQIDEAFEAGASVSTHLGNGVYRQLDRFSNPVWPQLTNTKNTITIIADGVHVSPDLVHIFSMCKDDNHTILISDLAPVAGLKEKNLKWGNIAVDIADDGSIRLSGTPYLAGAGSSLLRNLLNYCRFTGKSLSSAVRMATINPIRTYGLDAQRVCLTQGKPVEMVMFSTIEDIGTPKKVISLQGGLI